MSKMIHRGLQSFTGRPGPFPSGALTIISTVFGFFANLCEFSSRIAAKFLPRREACRIQAQPGASPKWHRWELPKRVGVYNFDRSGFPKARQFFDICSSKSPHARVSRRNQAHPKMAKNSEKLYTEGKQFRKLYENKPRDVENTFSGRKKSSVA